MIEVDLLDLRAKRVGHIVSQDPERLAPYDPNPFQVKDRRTRRHTQQAFNLCFRRLDPLADDARFEGYPLIEQVLRERHEAVRQGLLQPTWCDKGATPVDRRQQTGIGQSRDRPSEGPAVHAQLASQIGFGGQPEMLGPMAARKLRPKPVFNLKMDGSGESAVDAHGVMAQIRKDGRNT